MSTAIAIDTNREVTMRVTPRTTLRERIVRFVAESRGVCSSCDRPCDECGHCGCS